MQVERVWILFSFRKQKHTSGKRVSKARELTCQSDSRLLLLFVSSFFTKKKKQKAKGWIADSFLTFSCSFFFYKPENVKDVVFFLFFYKSRAKKRKKAQHLDLIKGHNICNVNVRESHKEIKKFLLTDGLGWDQVVGEVKATPSQWPLAGLKGRSATPGLRHGPDTYGWQQWGILGNGRKPDPATSHEWRRLIGRKTLTLGKIMT